LRAALSRKSNIVAQFGHPTCPQAARRAPTQIALESVNRLKGEAMQLNKADDRPSQAEDRPFYEHDKPQNLMTPARRAALDALERELRELLGSRATS